MIFTRSHNGTSHYDPCHGCMWEAKLRTSVCSGDYHEHVPETYTNIIPPGY